MRAFDNPSTVEILARAAKKEPKDEKTLYVFAGPNGSGKSTLIANKIYDGQLSETYVNADMMLLQSLDNDFDNEKAMFSTMHLVEQYIEEGKAFCYETVLSHPSKLDLMKKAKEHGYKIVATFVYTNSPDINVSRVKVRARQGGHDVPEDKIRSRYYRSLENAKLLQKIADEFYMFDNSENRKIESLFGNEKD